MRNWGEDKEEKVEVLPPGDPKEGGGAGGALGVET